MGIVEDTVSKANDVELELNEAIDRVEKAFISFCKANNIKFDSKTYYKYQHIYFNGASMAMNHLPAKWGVSIMSSRSIVPKEEF